MARPLRTPSSAGSRLRLASVALFTALLFPACTDTPVDSLVAPKTLSLAVAVEATRQARLMVVLPASEAGPVPSTSADFGPATYGASGPVVEVAGLACFSLPTNTVPGAIAIIQRGECVFTQKVMNAQIAGYAGVLIYNNAPGAMTRLGGSNPDVTIGAQGLTQDAGLAILNQIRAGNQVVVNMLGFMGVEGELPPRLVVVAPATEAGPIPSTSARFGPTTYGVSGPLVNVSGNACATLPANTITGAIALVERGTCTFAFKALMAQNAGYAGIIIYNNVDGQIPALGSDGSTVLIPAQGINRAEGLAFISQLAAGTQVIVAMFGYPDQSPPVVQAPDDVVADATTAAGATVNFVVNATDDFGPVTAICTPPSGSLFAIGTTLVTCTATDLAGNEGTGSFLVTVLGAQGQALRLEEVVRNLSLRPGIEQSLATKLEGAAAALERGDTGAACAKLSAFSHEVSAQNGKSLTPDEAASLETAVARIRTVAGC